MPTEQNEEERSTSKKFEVGDIVYHTALGHGPRAFVIITCVFHDGDHAVVLLASGRFFVDKIENFVVI